MQPGVGTSQQNQRLSQWSFGLLLSYLTYKLLVEGITLTTIDESYTTQTCPVCGRRKKVSGRIYKCSCGYTLHRDLHGARNILSKHQYGKICDIGITPQKVTCLLSTG
ncbi:MAG: zinc ribbon domain-containing protein [Desulfitobacteriaceae bacterium]